MLLAGLSSAKYTTLTISVRATESILPKIKVARQDNITQGGTCPGRMERRGTHIHTHDTNYPTLLLRDIQVTDTECTPCKHRIDAEATQDLRRAVTAQRP